MASVNIVHLIGNAAKDPEFKAIRSGSVVNFTIATSDVYNTKDGNKREEVYFHNCQAWGKLAEVIRDYVKKGDRVFISGSITYEHYDDKDGNKRTATRIKVEKLVMLGGGKKSDKAESAPEPAHNDEPDGDLPF